MTSQPAPADTGIVELVHALAATVRREFSARMEDQTWAKDANLRRGCFGVLLVVARADDAVSQREVADRVGIDQSDVVDLVDRLETAGLLRRRRDDNDRRRYALELTAAGRTAIERFRAVACAVDDAVLASLDHDERMTLRDLLLRVVSVTPPR